MSDSSGLEFANDGMWSVAVDRRPPLSEDRAAALLAASAQTLENRAVAAVTGYPFSMVAWFRTSTAGTNKCICGVGFDANNYHALFLLSTNLVRFMMKGASGVTAGPLFLTEYADGQWHLAVAVCANKDSQLVSLDGSAFLATSTEVVINTAYNVTAIGVRAGGSFPWNGDLDEVMFFNSALDINDVAALWNAGQGVLASDLVTGMRSLPTRGVPIHAYNLSGKNINGDRGRDLVRTAAPIDLTSYNGNSDAIGIPAGQP